VIFIKGLVKVCLYPHIRVKGISTYEQDKELESMKREPVLDVCKTGNVIINVTLFCFRVTFVAVEKQ
jgi:hypothetical protein